MTKQISIVYLGDVCFNDNYIKYYKKYLNPFKNVQKDLKNKDYIIGNLECIAKGDHGENLKKKPRLKTTVETLNYLKILNINIVSLAHNHIYDHLDDGFIKTISFLKKNNIKYLGASIKKDFANKYIIIKKNDIRIGFLNYLTLDTNPQIPNKTKININLFNINKTIIDIKKLKKITNHVVLLLHWGGRVEGGLFPDFNQPDIAKKLIDAGADLIIGHHSHTIQPFEIYKNKYIFYSIGNFCFSDYFFEGKFNPMPLRRNITMLVSVIFKKKKYKIELNFFINKKKYFLKTNYLFKLKLRNLLFNKFFKNNYFWKIYYFHKNYILNPFIFINRKDLTFLEKIQRLNIFIKRKLL
jgi:hypothetical protein